MTGVQTCALPIYDNEVVVDEEVTQLRELEAGIHTVRGTVLRNKSGGDTPSVDVTIEDSTEYKINIKCWDSDSEGFGEALEVGSEVVVKDVHYKPNSGELNLLDGVSEVSVISSEVDDEENLDNFDDNGSGEETTQEERVDSIKKMIESKDGATIEEIVEEVEGNENKVEQTVKNMMRDGDLFEPRKDGVLELI